MPAALVWFLMVWMGYGGWFSEGSRWAIHGVQGASRRHRHAWAQQMAQREVRVSDAALGGDLMQTVSFSANTTIYIIAGLLALLGTLDQVMSFAAGLPFASKPSRALWELKLLGAFVVAYFKFTCSIRQFNVLSILNGGTPTGGEGEPPGRRRYARWPPSIRWRATSSTALSASTTSA